MAFLNPCRLAAGNPVFGGSFASTSARCRQPDQVDSRTNGDYWPVSPLQKTSAESGKSLPDSVARRKSPRLKRLVKKKQAGRMSPRDYDLVPAFLSANAPNNQVLATFQSRLTVSGEIPSTSAVSSTLKPPK